MTLPTEQIEDAHKLNADGLVDLFELVPSVGSGTLYFKADNSVTWQSNLYTGFPLTFSGDKRSASKGSPQPTLAIGDQSIDLSIFKPLIHDGNLDGALITRCEILLDDLLADRDVKSLSYYRVRRVTSYSRKVINLQLASYSGSLGFTMPFRTFTPPDFPAVSR